MDEIEGSLHIDVAVEADGVFDHELENASNNSDKLEIMCENEASASVDNSIPAFIEGQAVQLEDGSTAYIYRKLKDDMDQQHVQSINLDDGSTAYIHQPTSCSAITQTDLLIDESKSPQNFRCDEDGCGKLYSSSHHLRVHKRSHTGEKPYKCDWQDCVKSFSTSYSLRAHIRVHTGEKPYNCQYVDCGKAFKTAGDLRKHVRVHTGEKPYKCPFQGCGKAFTTTNICKVHIRTHTGERPYKCPFPDCEKMFKNSTNYKNHVRIHTGEKPFVCDFPECDRRFTEYSSFYKHKVVHANDRKKSCARTQRRPDIEKKDYNNIYFKCSHCAKTFTQRSAFLNHKFVTHSESNILESEEKLPLTADKKNGETDTSDSKYPILGRNRYGKTTRTNEKPSCSEESHVVLLPVRRVASESSGHTTPSNTIAQVTAVVSASSGQQLAILSHNGSSQQFTLALTDQGSTLLTPPTESVSNIVAPVKTDTQVVYISDTGSGRNMMSIIEKDNTLQRIEASENNSSTSDTTPINTDIWLHQPQTEEISGIDVKDENSLKRNDNINIQYESTSAVCDDVSSSDSIAYLEIGGAKYQLKIVTAESETVDQVCTTTQAGTNESIVQNLQMWPDSNKDLTFLTTNDQAQEDNNGSEIQINAIHYADDGTLPIKNISSNDESSICKKRKL